MSEVKEKKRFDWKNLGIRLLGAVCFLSVLIPAAILGGYFWLAPVSFIMLGGTWEFYRAFGIHKAPIGIMGYISAVVYIAILVIFGADYQMAAVALGFILIMSAYVFDFHRMTAEKALAAFGGFMYLTVMTSYLYLMRNLEDGLILVGLTLLIAWGCDVFAYLTGMALGRHKMSPHLSPKKSIEGAVGGVLGGVLICGLFAYLTKEELTEVANPILAFMAIAFAGAFVSMVGDLLASAFKRHTGIKDYSKLIPGHGGLVDRFDSVIFIAPVVYYLALFFSKG